MQGKKQWAMGNWNYASPITHCQFFGRPFLLLYRSGGKGLEQEFLFCHKQQRKRHCNV
ncbi:hypothetical protein [Treponema sp. OMZ 857]|uniref:hypothetical protein n=1 Tax=Treponema sp. OMZ 857 TaxID=1643513 RepID=UPI0020A2763B|nr:hypothetical protein [Treponema sp. OMZ 857]UTC44085.1 hypothetical protein E4N66_08380 [Treponema sp. OMZ 857]